MIAQIDPHQLKALLESGESVYLLDVRQPQEHAYCALPHSTHIPLHELSERLDEVTPTVGATVVVYCHHGVRSLSGAAILQQAGHAKVASLRGGIEAWSLLIDPTVPRY